MPLKTHIAGGGSHLWFARRRRLKQVGNHTRKPVAEGGFQKKIIRIDSETIEDPPAYGCIANLNEILQQYDIVLASPSIETGVSLELMGHFTSVGHFPVYKLKVQLVKLRRLREPVDRHIWAASHGIGQIGNGSTSSSPC